MENPTNPKNSKFLEDLQRASREIEADLQIKKPLEEPIYKAKIKVIGIGGGGSSIISEIAPNVKKAGFIYRRFN